MANSGKSNKNADHFIEDHIEKQVKQMASLESKTEFWREMFFLFLLTIFSVILVILSVQLFVRMPEKNGPGTYPLIASGGMLLCSVITIIQLILQNKRNGGEMVSIKNLKLYFMTEIPFTVLIMALATIAYVVGMSLVGFYLPTFVYMWFSSFFLFEGKKENLLKSVMVGVGTAFAVWLIIDKIFQIRMP
jgi:hypothetical protein